MGAQKSKRLPASEIGIDIVKSDLVSRVDDIDTRLRTTLLYIWEHASERSRFYKELHRFICPG